SFIDQVTSCVSTVVYSRLISLFCFFFQAEDGIRDRNVTGVQTCALPISHSSGVYIMYGASGQILYVGKAKDLFKRVHQYFGNKANRTEKVLRLVQKVDDIKYIITRNEVEALVLENNLIKKHKPPYNILLKDDKSYPFVKIDVKADFPRVEVVRKLK